MDTEKPTNESRFNLLAWLRSFSVEGLMRQPMRSPRIGLVTGILATLCFCLAGWNFRREPYSLLVIPYAALNWTFIGGLLITISLFCLRPRFTEFVVSREQARTFPINWIFVVLAVLMLFVLTLANNAALQLDQNLQFLLLVAGSAGLAIGFGGFRDLKFRPEYAFSQLKRLSWSTVHVVALILIVVVGFVLRVWQLDTAVHITVDEMHFWNGVVALQGSSTTPILMPIDYLASFTHIYPYFQKLAVGIFGPDLFAMRFPSAVIGTLTILTIYFLVREGLDKKTALMAAALLAVFPPEIHFSRSALNNVADALPGTLAFAFLIRGAKYNSQRDYVLAGVCLGWTAFFYEGGRLLFLGLFAVYLAYLLVTVRPWSHLRNWLLMGICAVLIFAPYYYTLSNGGYGFSMRLADRSGPQIEKYTEIYQTTHSLVATFQQYFSGSLAPPFYHIVYAPDLSRLYYGGQTALLQWFLVPFFLLGIFLALFLFRRFGVLLLLWVFLTGLGASLVFGSGWTARLVVYFVPVIVLLAMGLRYLFEAMLPKFKVALYGLVAIFIVVAGAYQINYYFTSHLETYNRQVRQFRYDFQDAFFRTVEIDPSSHLVYVVQPIPDHANMDEEELGTWIKFKQIALTYEIVNAAELTPAKIDQLSRLYRQNNLIFAIEPSVLLTDDRGNALPNPRPVLANQQAHDLIVRSFSNAREQLKSPYSSVPLFQQYQLLIVPPATN